MKRGRAESVPVVQTSIIDSNQHLFPLGLSKCRSVLFLSSFISSFMKWSSEATAPQIPLGFKVLIHSLVWASHFIAVQVSLVVLSVVVGIYLSAMHIIFFCLVSSVECILDFVSSLLSLSLLKILIKKNANMVYEYLKYDLHLTNYTWSHNSQCDFASGKKWDYVFYIKCIAFKYFNTNKLYLNINLSPKDLARHIKYLKLFLVTKFLNS